MEIFIIQNSVNCVRNCCVTILDQNQISLNEPILQQKL